MINLIEFRVLGTTTFSDITMFGLCVLQSVPNFTNLSFVDRDASIKTMVAIAEEMLLDHRRTTVADKKSHRLCAIDGGSGSGKTRLGFEFAKAANAKLKLDGSRYLFLNFGNGSIPITENLKWGVPTYLGVRIAIQLLLLASVQFTTGMVTQVMTALSNEVNIVESFRLEHVLANYADLATEYNNVATAGVKIPLNIFAHLDEAQFMLGFNVWHFRDQTPESALRAICRDLMDASIGRRVFFFPYLSGTYPIGSLRLFEPTEYSVKDVTCFQVSPQGMQCVT